MNTAVTPAWAITTDADGIAWLTFDKPGTSTNVLSRDTLVELGTHLQALQQQPPRGLVIRSAKSSGFIAGADVREFVQLKDADQGFELVRAAQLHDLGKLAVPDEILHKAGPLDEREWAFVRQHPLVGERILRASPAFRTIATIVRSTHERWDGAGYPDGFAGSEIPVSSRIIAACDAFTAMTSARRTPYTRVPVRAPASVAACTCGTRLRYDCCSGGDRNRHNRHR